MSVVAVRGDAGSRGAARWSARRAAAACSRMHNSAFYLPLAALAHSTFPMMSHHNKRFRNHSALIVQDGRLAFCPLPLFLSQSTLALSHMHTRARTHGSSQSDKENREEASHNETTTVTGLKITQLHSHMHTHTHTRMSTCMDKVMHIHKSTRTLT